MEYEYGHKHILESGVDLEIFKPQQSKVLNSAHPIFLYVGRVAVEKNINAFLEIDLPGSKWVVGDGPAMKEIKEKYPLVNYLGVLNQYQLAEVYAAADVVISRAGASSVSELFAFILQQSLYN